MNQFTKRDKAILVIFVLLHILISSIARAVGVNMATSISFGFFTVLYLVYIYFSHKGKSSPEIKTESVKAKIFKFDSKLLLILLVVFVVGFGFYWYEIRPSRIREECSWVKKYTDAKPAIPPMSDDEIIAAGYEPDCTLIQKGGPYDNLYGIYADLKIKSCEEKKTGRPAEAAKDWLEKASESEYKFCLHSKGL